jgi:hypothetical protein
MCMWAVVVVLLVVTLLTLSLIYLPWWGTGLVLLALMLTLALSFKWIAGKVMERFFIGIFDIKSKALREAGAEVHSVKQVEAPVRESDMQMVDEQAPPEQAKEEPVRIFYAVEATITPKPAMGKAFHLWDIDDVMMVPYDLKVTRSADEGIDDETCEIRRVLVQRDGVYAELEESKLEGPHRLEFLVGVKPGVKRLKFRYYFEAFGDVQLPE